MPILYIQAVQRIFFGGILQRNSGRVFGQVGCQMTRKEMLDMIAMSGLTLKIFERLSWIPRSNWYRVMVSRSQVSGMNLKPIIFGAPNLRCLQFDEETSILVAGWDDTGHVRIIFSDGTFITHKMPRSVTNVTVLTPELIAVCSHETHAFLIQRNDDIFREIGIFQHKFLTTEDSVDVCCRKPKTGIIATADNKGHINLWSIDATNIRHPIFHCELKGHTRAVTQMMFHSELNMLISLDSSGKGIFWVLDGTGVLSSTVLTWKGKKATSFAFVPNTNMIAFGFSGPEIQFWSYEVNSDNHVVSKCVFQKEFDDAIGCWINSISFHPDFPAILIGTGTLEDGKRVPAYLLYWGTMSSGEIFVNVYKTLRRFFGYSTLAWAYGMPWIGN
jgi:WD40 repeat protein